jgi:hypothetical protein
MSTSGSSPGGNSSSTQDGLNGFSAAMLAIFVIASIFVIWPVRIPLPRFVRIPVFGLFRILRLIGPKRYHRIIADGWKLPISLETAPFIGVLILLASTTINGSTIRLGIKGDENIKPYDVLVLFISLVCMFISHIYTCSRLLGLHLHRTRWYWRDRSGCFLGVKTCWDLWSSIVRYALCFFPWNRSYNW